MKISIRQTDPRVARAKSQTDGLSVQNYQFLAQAYESPRLCGFGKTPEGALANLVIRHAKHLGLEISSRA